MQLLRISLLLTSIFCCLMLFVAVKPVFAQNTDTNFACDPNNELCNQDLGDVPLNPGGIVNVIMKFSVALGGTIALILIIYGGYKMVTSSGNPAEVKKARDIITYAIIGLLLILFSVAIFSAVNTGIIPLPDLGS